MIARQFKQRQFHAPLRLAVARLRCEEPHRESGKIGIGGRDLRLQQRSKDGIGAEPCMKPVGKLGFERKRMHVADQRITFEQQVAEPRNALIAKLLLHRIRAK